MFLYISLYDVGLLILFILALTIGFYLIVVLRRLTEVVVQVVIGVRKTVEATSSAVISLEDNLVDTADRVQETLDTAMLYARCASEVVKAVVGAFGRSSEK